MVVEVGQNQIVSDSSAIDIAQLYRSIHQLASNFWADTQGMCWWQIGIEERENGDGTKEVVGQPTRHFIDCGQSACERSAANPAHKGKAIRNGAEEKISKFTSRSNPN